MSERHVVRVEANETRAIASTGPDYDEILRDLLRAFMSSENIPPDMVAEGFGVEPREFKRFLKGGRATLLFASKLAASMGISFHDLMCTHSMYGTAAQEFQPTSTISLSELQLYRFGRQASSAEIELGLEWSKVGREHPILKQTTLRGMAIGIAALEKQGIDVLRIAAMMARALGESHSGRHARNVALADVAQINQEKRSPGPR